MKTYLTETALGVVAVLIGTAALADTKIINGCEVRKADNGNYYSRVDGGCNGTLGAFFKPSGEEETSYSSEEPSEPTDPGEEGPGDEGGEEGPGDGEGCKGCDDV